MYENDLYFRRFSLLADILEQYIINHILISQERAEIVGKNFLDVIQNCDTVNFDNPGVVESYSILHFLERYQRFIKIMRYLINLRLLPIRDELTEILDIGTGPAPALFAISDIYSFFRIYGRKLNDPVFRNVEFRNDYSEISKGFRDWLHHFTEFSQLFRSRENDINGLLGYLNFDWKVPFHHGRYYDIKGVDFRKIKSKKKPKMNDYEYYDYEEDAFEYDFSKYEKDKLSWKNEYRHDVIIMSNFITQVDQLNDLKSEILSCGDSLRDSGIIIIVGGRYNQYPIIYKTLKLFFRNNSFRKKRSIGFCKEIQLPHNTMRSNRKSRYRIRIRQMYRNILFKFEELNALDSIPNKEKKIIEKLIEMDTGKDKWALYVYKKFFKTKQEKIKYTSKSKRYINLIYRDR